jgi:hypothetical protein
MAYTKRPVRKVAPKRRAASKKSMTKKVTALARTVKKLATVSYDKVNMSLVTSSVGVVQPYYQYHINNIMSSWTPVFGYDAGDLSDVNKCYVNSYKIDARISQGSEADQIYYSMFVVSLKDDAADSTTFDPATGALNLASGTHYTTLGANGKVLINPRMFNIHSYKRFYMGGRAGDQSAPCLRDVSFTIVPKQKLITNPKGNIFGIGGLSFPKDPSKNYYLLLFNDDSGADFQVNTITVGGLASCAIPN